MNRVSRAVTGALVVAAVVAGCAAGRADSDVVSRGDAILFGSPDSVHASVVVLKLVDALGDAYRCSGVVVAPRLVLTAAHCLEGVVSGKVGFGPVDDATATWTDVTEFIPHPRWQASSGGHPSHPDLALVRIASQPEGLAAARLLPADLAIEATDVGSLAMEFVGYGLTETRASGTRLHSSAAMSFACLGASECTWWRNAFSYAYIAPGAFCHLRTTAGTCKGDSGGPAFITRNGMEYVAGISSFGDTACQTHGCHAGLDHAFLDPYIAAAQPSAACASDATCSNLDPCDGVERCVEGRCVAGTPLACDDGSACTIDTCVAGAGCRYVPMTCSGGACEVCDPVRGCVAANEGSICAECKVCRGGACGADPSCSATETDAAVVEHVDAGPAVDEPSHASDGCSFAGTAHTGAGHLGWAVASALALAHRRRRR